MKRSILKVQKRGTMSSRRSRQRRWQSHSKKKIDLLELREQELLSMGGEDAAAGISLRDNTSLHVEHRLKNFGATESHTSHKKSCKAIHKESRQVRRRMQDVRDDIMRLEN